MFNFVTFEQPMSFMEYVVSLQEFQMVDNINSVYESLKGGIIRLRGEYNTYFKALLLLFDYSAKSLPFGQKYVNVVTMISMSMSKIGAAPRDDMFEMRCMEVFKFIVQKAVVSGVTTDFEYDSVMKYIKYRV